MVLCPTCKTENKFDTARGMNIHHTKEHGFSLSDYQEGKEWVHQANIDWTDEDNIKKLYKQMGREIKKNEELLE